MGKPPWLALAEKHELQGLREVAGKKSNAVILNEIILLFRKRNDRTRSDGIARETIVAAA